jgi:hypothetical protein
MQTKQGMSIQYVITVTPAQDKALRSIAVDVQALIDNYVQQRAAVEIDAIVRRELDRKRAAGEPRHPLRRSTFRWRLSRRPPMQACRLR